MTTQGHRHYGSLSKPPRWAIGIDAARIYLAKDLPSRPARRQKEGCLELAVQDQDWRAGGLCAKSNPDLFFAVGALEHKQAKRICRSCPVQQQCLNYAMESRVDHGIWGGLTERERRRQRRMSVPHFKVS